MEQIPSRITIKIGSNVLTRSNGTLDVTRMSALVDQIARLYQKGVEVILISSGAVASGRSEIRETTKLDNVDQRQLFSAVGQVKLINRYYELFREYHIPIGQVLTTKENFSTRRHYLTQKNCMAVMLANGIIPIVNENDTISVSELMFTDNDELSGLIASMMNAQQLIILSNIDGIYNGNPADPNNQVVRTIQQGEDLSTYIQTSKSAFGRGGMLTKTRIASKVADEGIAVVIANGKREQILTDLIDHPEETICTRFIPNEHPVSNVKKWIAHSDGFAKGEVHLNEKATRIITQTDKASSILPIGVTRIEGDFEKDDIVRLIDFEGKTIGVGKSDYSAEQARKSKGKHGERPIVHYDYLYIE
ncbi:MAG: glutamate 5-kinase [Bacteroidia bacterium]|nr:glutamate 5-kinase [Bacteroidia bacterium]